MIGPLLYMDPGTGSLLLQLILGGVAGLFVFLKLFWHRILAMVGLGGTAPPHDPPETEGDVTPTGSEIP